MNGTTVIYTGRPARFFNSKFLLDWEEHRQDEIKAAVRKGIVPVPCVRTRALSSFTRSECVARYPAANMSKALTKYLLSALRKL